MYVNITLFSELVFKQIIFLVITFLFHGQCQNIVHNDLFVCLFFLKILIFHLFYELCLVG